MEFIACSVQPKHKEVLRAVQRRTCLTFGGVSVSVPSSSTLVPVDVSAFRPPTASATSADTTA